MQAKQMISDVVPVLHTYEKGQKALNWMEIFRISHLPVIDDEGDYIGLISDNEIYDFNLDDKKVGTHKLSLQRPYVQEDAHIFQVISQISEHKLSIVAVLDSNMTYLGVITQHDVLQHFGKLTASGEKGAVFILEVKKHDYFLSQISQIIESNDAKILSSYFSPSTEKEKAELTIKINTSNFSPIRQALERYGYVIKDTFSTNDAAEKALDEKYDEFMSFLNI